MQRNPNVAQDVAKALADIETEKNSSVDELVSGHPSSQAILLAKKRMDRMREGKTLHAFVLTQDNPEKTEFSRFIAELKAHVAEIKPGTRIMLNVITTYVDTVHDKDLYEKGLRECAHWTPVDLLVEENGQVSSVILDASDSFGHRRLHSELKAMFPESKHNIFHRDVIDDGKQKKERPIQTQKVGCRTFSIEHIKQLTQIDPNELRKEVSEIADEEGSFSPGVMRKNTKILRTLRGMQTVTGFEALSPEVLHSPVKGRKTLEEVAHETIEGRINKMVIKRSHHYKEKKRDYLALLAPGELQMIMENKNGTAFLHNTILFSLCDALTSASRESVCKMINAIKRDCENEQVECLVTGLQDTGQSNECIKTKLLLRLESSLLNLEIDQHEDKRQQLTDIIKRNMKLLKKSEFNQAARYLSPDRMFATNPGRSARPERKVAPVKPAPGVPEEASSPRVAHSSPK